MATLSLRVRLIAVFAIVLTALAGLGAWGAWRLWQMGAVSNRIIADNYQSVVAAQQMKDSLERQDSAMLFLVMGERGRAEQQLAQHRAEFGRAFAQAAGNITEAGESGVIEDIRNRFAEYSRVLDRFMAPGAPTVNPAEYFAEAEPPFNAIRADCDRLLALNQDAMRRKAGEAASISRANFVAAVTLAVALTVAGILLSAWLAGSLLGSVGRLTAATCAVAAGDLDVTVPVSGQDEIAQLARAFNDMAGRLRQVRDSNLGELLRARQVSDAAIDSLYDPVVVTDANGVVTRLNAAAGLLLGPETSVRGKRLADVATDARVAAAVDEVLRSQHAVAQEGAAATLVMTVGAAERSFRLRSTPMRAADGGLLGAVVLLEDVTHLREVDRLKSEFIAAASHELRTPLMSFQMSVHLLLEDAANLTDRQQELLYLCRDESARLARLSIDLLDLSKIESGEAPPRLARVSCSALVRGAVEPLRLQVEARDLTLTVDLPPDLPAVMADRGQIERVLANLVTNAARVTAPGGRMAVTASRTGDHVSIAVADTGCGIPAEYVRRIFDPFVQVPGVPSGGAGLGLAISRHIVEAHGGQMTVHSTVGEGSTFTLTLPVAQRA